MTNAEGSCRRHQLLRERAAALRVCRRRAFGEGGIERHGDGSINFDVRLLTGTGPTDTVSAYPVKDAISTLFSGDSDIALFYFAGHGHIEATGGYILASDSKRGDEGVSLAEVLTIANGSNAKNKIIVLDSCHSGIAGTPPLAADHAVLSEGLTVLTASTKDQYAAEDSSGGIFTALFVDALSGAACNLVGEITPGSVYAHIDQSLGAWDQRPVFKTNVKSFVSLRTSPPGWLSGTPATRRDFSQRRASTIPLIHLSNLRLRDGTRACPRRYQNTHRSSRFFKNTTASTSSSLSMLLTCGMPRWRASLAN